MNNPEISPEKQKLAAARTDETEWAKSTNRRKSCLKSKPDSRGGAPPVIRDWGRGEPARLPSYHRGARCMPANIIGARRPEFCPPRIYRAVAGLRATAAPSTSDVGRQKSSGHRPLLGALVARAVRGDGCPLSEAMRTSLCMDVRAEPRPSPNSLRSDTAGPLASFRASTAVEQQLGQRSLLTPPQGSGRPN